MSKLPKAPLVEVVFGLKWQVKKSEIEKYRYFSGDFHGIIKNSYPERKALIPDGIPLPLYLNNPSHKFSSSNALYPAIQIGPGVLTVNTIDEFYYWEDYRKHISKAVNSLFKIIKEFSDIEHVHLYLDYIDFLPFDFTAKNVFQYLKKFLHVDLSQSFYNQEEVDDLNLMFEFRNPIGSLNIEFSRGLIKEDGNDEREQRLEGIMINTSAISGSFSPTIDEILNWADKAHDLCSQTFKEMTKGELYQSFS